MEFQQASIRAAIPAIPDVAAAQPAPYTLRFVLTIPIVYAGIPLFVALDLFLAIYQWLCFPPGRFPASNAAAISVLTVPNYRISTGISA